MRVLKNGEVSIRVWNDTKSYAAAVSDSGKHEIARVRRCGPEGGGAKAEPPGRL